MHNILISIIVPIYNVEKYLDRSITSILNQSYKHLEIILVDDGSLDNSYDKCRYYKEIDTRIILIQKGNGGLSDARNVGLEKASGDYVMFLDSDDYLELNAVEDLLKIAEESQADIVICGYQADYVDSNEQLLLTKEYKAINGIFTKDDYKNIPIDIELIGIIGYAWNKLYSKKLIDNHNFRFTKGLSLVEDIVFNGPLLSMCSTIAFTETPYIHYMQRPRETLGSTFYENYFNLREQAISSVKSMLLAMGRNENEISNIVNQIRYNTLKTTIRLLSKEESYSYERKKIYLKSLLNENVVQEGLNNYVANSFKDKLIKFLMIHQKERILLSLYNMHRD